MTLYNNKTHVKDMEEVKREIKKVAKLDPSEEKLVVDKIRSQVHTSTGMSKEELNKIIRGFEKNTKDKINPEEVRNLRRLAE